MAQDLRLVKLVSGEFVLGNYDKKAGVITQAASIQVNIKAQGMQVMILPYGYPFQNEFTASIDEKHIIYTYETLPETLEAKYHDACLRPLPALKATVPATNPQ